MFAGKRTGRYPPVQRKRTVSSAAGRIDSTNQITVTMAHPTGYAEVWFGTLEVTSLENAIAAQPATSQASTTFTATSHKICSGASSQPSSTIAITT